jgi:catechol 2,3-dioxygenase-like lactoylglutathione lyase family enzyme
MAQIRHIGIVVNDLERALSFYRDLLGMTVVRKMDESGDFIDKLLGLVNASVTTVKLSLGPSPTLIELLHFKSPARPVESACTKKVFTPGLSHIAFTVPDVDLLYRRLSEAGIVFNAPPELSVDGGAKVAYCRDPEGNFLELVQVFDTPEIVA